jgi:hypothetical protein
MNLPLPASPLGRAKAFPQLNAFAEAAKGMARTRIRNVEIAKNYFISCRRRGITTWRPQNSA